jgi:hypothetical protein
MNACVFWQMIPTINCKLCHVRFHGASSAAAAAVVNLEAHYQLPPHTLFDILADPFVHDKIFDAILVSPAVLIIAAKHKLSMGHGNWICLHCD